MKSQYLTIVTNDESGLTELAEIRRIAKLNGCKVKIRGRNPNRAKLALDYVNTMYPNGRSKKTGKFVSKRMLQSILFWTKQKLQLDVPKNLSTYFAVYVSHDNEYITPDRYVQLYNQRLIKFF